MSDAAACCAEFYERDWVASLLGDSFHPGGAALSERLIDGLNLPPDGAVVLDLACGTGTTALALAARGHHVVAIDYSAKNIERARVRAEAAGVEGAVQFHVADAHTLPLDDAQLDAAVVECAVSTFADKAAVADELLRVLRPGALLGVSDMVVNRALPSQLARAIGPWACLQDALSVTGYQRLFLDAGLRAVSYADESPALIQMARDLKRKLVVLGLGKMAGALTQLDLDIGQARDLLDQARALVEQGTVEYCRLTFGHGVPRPTKAEPKRAADCSGAPGCC